MEEERTYKKLKERAMKERIIEELGKKREKSDVQVELKTKQKTTMEDSKTIEDYPDQARKTTLTSLRKTTKMKKSGRGPGNNSPVAKKVVSQQELQKTPNVKSLASMFTNKQFHLTSARDCGQVANIIFTMFTVTMESRLQLIPNDQLEERGRFEIGSRRLPDQSDHGNEQIAEQKTQIGLTCK